MYNHNNIATFITSFDLLGPSQRACAVQRDAAINDGVSLVVRDSGWTKCLTGNGCVGCRSPRNASPLRSTQTTLRRLVMGRGRFPLMDRFRVRATLLEAHRRLHAPYL